MMSFFLYLVYLSNSPLNSIPSIMISNFSISFSRPSILEDAVPVVTKFKIAPSVYTESTVMVRLLAPDPPN